LTTNVGSSLPARALRVVEIAHADRGFLADAGAVGHEHQVVQGKEQVVVGRRFPVEHVEAVPAVASPLILPRADVSLRAHDCRQLSDAIS
jgi:hypothetical protein